MSIKAAGIVAEYNPFHNGHKYHIEKTRELSGAGCVIAVMSGNYVQRGEPALFSKHARAQAAVEGGADLVLELPAYFALKSAQGFASGAVGILEAAGADCISFGAECPDISILREAGISLSEESAQFSLLMKENLKSGMSFARARALTVQALMPRLGAVISAPNNILAIEYIAALQRAGSTMEPVAVQRVGAGHDEDKTADGIASASHIRKMYKAGEDAGAFMPSQTAERPLFLEDFEQLILYSLLNTDIEKVADTGDGLARRLLSVRADNLEELLAGIKTKRFAMARIKRVLMNILIGNTLPSSLPPSYLRVLALNDTGARYLKEKEEGFGLPLIIKPSLYKKNEPLWELEKRAARVRNIAFGGGKEELELSPVFVRNQKREP